MAPVICVPLYWQSSVVGLWKKFYASSSQEPIHKREKRWPGCSVFIDDDKPCRRCHSNHPPCTHSPCSQRWQWQCDREQSLILSLWSRCYLRRLCHCLMTATLKALLSPSFLLASLDKRVFKYGFHLLQGFCLCHLCIFLLSSLNSVLATFGCCDCYIWML